MSSKLASDVREFMTAFKQALPEKPCVPADEVVRLRARLIVEECFEMLDACFEGDNYFDLLKRDTLADIGRSIVRVDLPEYADALADLAYVVEGANAAFGIDGDAVLDIVHKANLEKRGGPVDEHGKQRKPAGWQPPDIAAEIQRQCEVKR